jgi:hypothetical protein
MKPCKSGRLSWVKFICLSLRILSPFWGSFSELARGHGLRETLLKHKRDLAGDRHNLTLTWKIRLCGFLSKFHSHLLNSEASFSSPVKWRKVQLPSSSQNPIQTNVQNSRIQEVEMRNWIQPSTGLRCLIFHSAVERDKSNLFMYLLCQGATEWSDQGLFLLGCLEWNLSVTISLGVIIFFICEEKRLCRKGFLVLKKKIWIYKTNQLGIWMFTWQKSSKEYPHLCHFAFITTINKSTSGKLVKIRGREREPIYNQHSDQLNAIIHPFPVKARLIYVWGNATPI